MRIPVIRGLVSFTAAGTLTLLGLAGAGTAAHAARTARPTAVGQHDAAISDARGAQAAAGGQAWAWGLNDHGQLGDGTTTKSQVPVKVLLPAGTTVTAVSAGRFHSLALTSAGHVLAWGENLRGELGDGTKTDSNVPVRVKLPRGVKVVAISAGFGHSLAVTSSGQVFAWGNNQRGQLGDGSTTDRLTPVRVHLPAGTKVTAVSAGAIFSLALTSTGRVLAWGLNHRGQLGIGVTRDRHIPVRVKLPRGVKVTGIAAGYTFGLAVTSSGRVFAWGNNDSGQLGIGTTFGSDIPVRVHLAAGTKVIAVAAGADHSLALTASGHVLAWGMNNYGQLGLPANHPAQSKVPVRMPLPPHAKVAAISGGFIDSLLLTKSGTILARGVGIIAPPHGVKLPAGLIAAAIASGSTAIHALAVLKGAG
jgi:alpha-tubulin suppressor-like RCC1 family protein